MDKQQVECRRCGSKYYISDTIREEWPKDSGVCVKCEMGDVNQRDWALTQRVDRMGVDLDTTSCYELLRTVLLARRLFPTATMTVQISASKAGFHVKIYQSVTLWENLCYRAMLNDCAYRLRFNIKKLWMNPAEKHNDILFDVKNGSEVEDITPIVLRRAELLARAKLHDDGSRDDETMVEVATNLQKDLESRLKPPWKTIINFGKVGKRAEADALKEKLVKVCTDTMEKDSTFGWKVYPSFHQNNVWTLLLLSGSKNQAYKRGGWLCRKAVPDEGLLYYVKEGI